MNSAIKAPVAADVHFTNTLGVYLAGSGGMHHLVNGEGNGIDSGHRTNYLCNHNFADGSATSISFIGDGMDLITDDESRFLY